MQTTEPKILSTYSCQFCQKDFQTDIEYIIIPHYCPLCSSLCLFRFIFKILYQYAENSLYFMAKELNIVKKDIHIKKELCYKLSQYFVKIGLSSINIDAQCSCSKFYTQQSEHKCSKVCSCSKNSLYSEFEHDYLSMSLDDHVDVSIEDQNQLTLWSFLK